MRRSRLLKAITSSWSMPESSRDTMYAYVEQYEETKWLKSTNIHMEKMQRPTQMRIKIWSALSGRAMSETFRFNAHHFRGTSLESHGRSDLTTRHHILFLHLLHFRYFCRVPTCSFSGDFLLQRLTFATRLSPCTLSTRSARPYPYSSNSLVVKEHAERPLA